MLGEVTRGIDRNTWNYTTECKLFVLDRNTSYNYVKKTSSETTWWNKNIDIEWIQFLNF